MKRFALITLVAVLALSLALSGCAPKPTTPTTPTPPPPVTKYVSIATGGTAGVYFPLGGSLADILNKSIPGMTATAQSTGASVANVNMIGTKEVELALVQNDIAYYALAGTEMFEGKKVANLRGITTLYNETIQLVATEASGIKSIADLKGKSVAVGAPGSGTEANARQILEAFGMTYSDLGKTDYLSFADAANNLKDGHVDAAFVTAGTPTAAVLEMSKTNRVIIVPITGAETDDLIAKYPFYAKVTIPAGTYDGQQDAVATVAVRAMIVVAAEVSDDLVFDITKALFTSLSDFGAAHARGKDLSYGSSQNGMPIALHPGADKYFKEVVASAPKQYLSIATGGTAGVYFPLGGSLADILNKGIPGMTATAQSTGASVANVNMIGTKEVELALVQNDIAYYALAGTEMFDGKKVANLRGITTLYNETVQLVATQASGIKSIADLKGKNVAVGAPGSGTEANARQILAAFGLSYSDLGKTDYLSYADAANNLKDGHIHAAFLTAGFPTAAVLEMSKTNRVVIVPISGTPTDELIADYPFYAKVTIPANTYDGQTAAVDTVAVRAMIVVGAEVSDDLVYDITKSLFTSLGDFGAAHARGRDLSLGSAQDGMPILLHPGAEKFFSGN
ncbi:MAG TPA: TAXI family TRAP transporter solute-binding subunit [Bacillota bacterium]|nr:TAXI family TRAP transporter solute-binding subunit [Bacillota bacterium]